MAYFAFEGGVSTSAAPGSIEIDEQQYSAAIDAIITGQEVTIDGGFALRDPRPSEYHVWRDGEWIDETPEPEPEPELPAPPLTARQLRLGLVLNGFTLAQVEATIEAIEDEQDREVARIEWEYASQFDRAHPLIEQVGAALGLTPEQIDAMWNEAITL